MSKGKKLCWLSMKANQYRMLAKMTAFYGKFSAGPCGKMWYSGEQEKFERYIKRAYWAEMAALKYLRQIEAA